MEIIEDKTKVSIAYVLKELSGRILEEVPPSYPFVYIHGYNNIIPGLESALLGRRLGEKFSVKIPSRLGYGEYRKDLVMQVPKDELRDVGELWLGMELEMFQDNARTTTSSCPFPFRSGPSSPPGWQTST